MQSRFNRVRKAGGNALAYYKAVYNYLDIVLFVFVKLYLFRKVVHTAVDANSNKARLCGSLELFSVLAFSAAHYRSENLQASSLWHCF